MICGILGLHIPPADYPLGRTMNRTMPQVHNEEIDLYIRTYYSLLRSSEPIRIRSLEETHAAMNSSLHQQANSAEIDVSALTYAALRVPDQVVDVRLMILGQMADVFVREGYHDVEAWQSVRARARRRKYYYDAESGQMAAFIASVSDIDDIIPCLTTLQIEWNKMHLRLAAHSVEDGHTPIHFSNGVGSPTSLEALRSALGLSAEDFAKLEAAWPGSLLLRNLAEAANRQLDLRVRVLGSGLSDYRRSVQQWWLGLVGRTADLNLTERPIYFISSNVHSVANMLSGYAADQRDAILSYIEDADPEGLRAEYQSLPVQDNGQLANLLYYASRPYCATSPRLRDEMVDHEHAMGIRRVTATHSLDVEAQVIDIRQLDPSRFDSRLRILDSDEWALLRQSDALIFNIDYPLGMAAYHILAQVGTAGGSLLGVYILGKAATLNGRVGDVMIPNVIYDEHSRNSFLFRNCITAQDVAPFLNYGTVFDNQKAVTVRGTILQNRRFMSVFYREGYTDIEMEAGPYLSGIYEDVYPQRYPVDEIVNLFINVPYDIGVIHYASDTPISRRQALLSKSLSYFGVDATYAGTTAVLRRVLTQEALRQRRLRREPATMAHA